MGQLSSVPMFTKHLEVPDFSTSFGKLHLPMTQEVVLRQTGEKPDVKADSKADIVKRFEEAAKAYEKATGKSLNQDLKGYDAKDKSGDLVPDERVQKIKEAFKTAWEVSTPIKIKIFSDKAGSALVDGKINGEIDLGTKMNSRLNFCFDPKTGDFSIVGGGFLVKETFLASNPASLIAGAKVSAGLFSPHDVLSDWADIKEDKRKEFLQDIEAKIGLAKGTLKDLNEIVSTNEKVAFVATDGAGVKATFVRTRDPKTGSQETTFSLEKEKK